MATLPPKELLALWKREQLSVEMATGHMLQQLVAQQSTNEALKQAVGLLQAQINNLTISPQSAPASAPKKKSGSRH